MERKRAHGKLLLPVGILVAVLAGVIVLRPSEGDSAGTVRTTMVGQHPTLVAVDARTGRAFVLNQGSFARNGSGTVVPGTISVLDTRTGAVVHTDPAGLAPQAVVVAVSTGRVFVVNRDNTVHALDARSGQVLRVVRLGGPSEAAVVDERTRRVFVLTQGPMRLSVLDAANGQLLGIIPLHSTYSQGPNIYALAADAHRRRLFALLTDPFGGLRVFDTAQRGLPHAIAVGQSGEYLLVDEQTGRTFMFEDTSVQVLTTATARPLHTITLGPDFNFGSAVLNERTGRLFVTSLTFDRNGYPSNSGQVYVLDGRSGAVLQRTTVGWPGGLAVDKRTGRVLVTVAGPHDLPCTYICIYSGAGSVAVLDGRSGAVLRTIPVGVAPQGVAVDPDSGHAFVVNDGGTVRGSDTGAWVPPWLRHVLPFLPPPAPATLTVPGSVSMLDLSH